MRRTLSVSTAVAGLVLVAVALAQSPSAPVDWKTYGGDLASTRYSPLDQINKDNFSKLKIAWRVNTECVRPA